MQTISFPIEWKKRWGFTSASILYLLMQREEERGSWIPIRAVDIQEALSIHPSGVVTGRERLRADQVVDVRRVGNSHEYRINHDVLAAIEAE